MEGEALLDALDNAVVSGGPPKDGIPSIDAPDFLSREAADAFLREDDVVFGIDVNGDVRAYPQRILVWHEIVNDAFGDLQIAITYCPLTGSPLAFRSHDPGGAPVTFGTTGKLVNSNLLMYDRRTDSHWPQIFATAIRGSRRGEALEELPLVWTTWSRWRTAHPDSRVLGPNTGFLRDYGADPYGSYTPLSGYYASDQLWFPVLYRSDRFPAKKVVYGLRHGGASLAIPLQEFRGIQVANVTVGGDPLALLYDGTVDTIRAFGRRLEGQTLTLSAQPGRFVDAQTGTTWSAEGVALDGPFAGAALPPVNAFPVMWFAWYAFYPRTAVYG